jgi:hypothetical protein
MSFAQPTIPDMMQQQLTRTKVAEFELKRLRTEVAALSNLHDTYVAYMCRYRREDQMRVLQAEQRLKEAQAKLQTAEETLCLLQKMGKESEIRAARADCDTYGHLFWRMREAEEGIPQLQFVLE